MTSSSRELNLVLGFPLMGPLTLPQVSKSKAVSPSNLNFFIQAATWESFLTSISLVTVRYPPFSSRYRLTTADLNSLEYLLLILVYMFF